MEGMELDQEQLECLGLMAQNEEGVAQLYQVYSQKFPGHQEFWLKLAQEEKEHANIIRGIVPHIQRGTVLLKENRFEKEAIQSFLKYLGEEINKATSGQLLPINALSIAFHIEKSLIEGKYFTIFEGDDPRLKELLDDLRVSTQDHVKRVETAWNLEREKSGEGK